MRLDRTLTAPPIQSIKVTDPFWSRWQQVVRVKTLEIQFRQMMETGRIENFRRVARGESGTFQGRYYNDSDVYKWIEAASYVVATFGPDPEAEKNLDEVIEAIAAAQMPDGYIHTFFQLNHPDLRWRNLLAKHEMYCMGHLIEGAVAHFEATGKRSLLDVAIRVADHVRSLFGLGKRKGYCGHQEFELALIRLSKVTGNDDYKELAKWMVDERGTRPSPFEQELLDDESMKLSQWAQSMLFKDGKYSGEYFQDHLPLRNQDCAVGHAVRCMYFFSAATDAFAGTGETEIEEALERIWTNLTQRRMYVTGGIGPSEKNEGFTSDFDLPNRTAYAETCAAVGLVFWAQRLNHATGDASFVDVLERALYNGAIAGISLEGDRFFYENPLESRGDHHRQEWFDCACCPPNIARLIASIGSYFVAIEDDTLHVNIPAGFEMEFRGAKITVESNYPTAGKIRITVDSPKSSEFELAIRVPGWCGDMNVTAPEGFPELEYQDGYARIRRQWSGSQTLEVDFEMPPRWLECDPRVLDNLGRAALTRGPLVYCLEEADLGFPVQRFRCDLNEEPTEVDGPFGTVGVKITGVVEPAEWLGELYEDLGQANIAEVKTVAVPYYVWDNRTPGSMQVWLRT